MYRVFEIISSFSVYIPFIAGLFLIKKLDKVMLVLVFQLGIATFTELLNMIFTSLVFSNLWIINIYTLIEALSLFYILRQWQQKRWMKETAVVLFLIYFVSWIYFTFIFGTIFEFNGNEKAVKAVFLIFLSIYPMIGFSMDDKLPVYQNYKFWICSAILLYYSVSVVLFGTANLAIDNTIAGEFIWIIHSFINIISNLIFAYGFLWYSRKMT